jgi:DNA-binding MarR family transcriptional regulator
VRDDNDGRSSWVRLTQAGVDLTEASMTEWTRAHADLFRTVPPEIAQSAADAMRQVLFALGDRERPPTGAPGTRSPSQRSRATPS